MAVVERESQTSSGWKAQLRRVNWRSPMTMFWVGLFVRVLYILVIRSYHFKNIEDHFQFGWEMGRISRALALGRGYSDPFVSFTGPTAWTPPAYPLLLAGVFKLFGVYSPLSGCVILCINSIFSVAIIPAVYEIAIRLYGRNAHGEKVALWSGWLWTLYPAAMQYAVRWVWEMSLTTMFFAWALVMVLRIRGIGDDPNAKRTPSKTRQWLLFGLLWGGIALSNPTPLLFLPVCGLWLLFHSENKLQGLRDATLAGIVCIACLAPWAIRNWFVFHAFVPIRANLGAELYMGNSPGADGFPWGTTLPIVNRAQELEKYRQMGEVKYSKMQGDKAKAYISSHRAEFLQVSLRRVYFYWAGVPHPENGHPEVEYTRELNFCFLSITGVLGLLLSIRRHIPASRLFACAFLLLPVSYYFVTSGARFRHPLEPLITVFSVYLFQTAEKSWRVRWFTR